MQVAEEDLAGWVRLPRCSRVELPLTPLRNRLQGYGFGRDGTSAEQSTAHPFSDPGDGGKEDRQAYPEREKNETKNKTNHPAASDSQKSAKSIKVSGKPRLKGDIGKAPSGSLVTARQPA
jgi:hypothetical protein